MLPCINLQVINECSEAEAWLREKKQQQDALPKFAAPVLLSADIKRKAEALDRYCNFLFKPCCVHSTLYLLFNVINQFILYYSENFWS